jgi:ligand-binding sensor domain-containing protein
MKNILKSIPALVASLVISINTQAQDRPIGFWRAHLPYNTSISVATNGSTAFVATNESFYTYYYVDDYLESFSKVDGMSDVGMSYVGYDRYTETVILAYRNSNIDLFKNGSFYNIPDLKNKQVTGSKQVNHIYCKDGLAYLSTDVGIVVVNIEKKEVKETYSFSANSQLIPVKGVTIAGDNIFAATPKGLYRNNINNINIQAFSTWSQIDTTRNLITIASVKDSVYTATSDSLFAVYNSNLNFVYKSIDTSILHVDAGKDALWLSEGFEDYSGKVKKLSNNLKFIDSFKTEGHSFEIAENNDGSVWVADGFRGLKRRAGRNDADFYTPHPSGPVTYSAFDIQAYNGELLVAHGGYDDGYKFRYNPYGFSTYIDDKWKNYKKDEYVPFGDSVYDFTSILRGPDGNIYAGSNQSGLFILKQNGEYEYYKQNSIIDPSYAAPNAYRVSGMAFDNNGNLWMTIFGGTHELVVKTKDGNWYEYFVPVSRPFPNSAANIIIDDYNQKWYVAPQRGGVMVYDDNNSPENPSDDLYRQLQSGKGGGGLPDNEAYCLAKDKNGAIWIGTANGIGIVNCPGQVIAGECESELRVVQYDQFPGNLFQNEAVKTIAVDGGNRKWIGTNNGVWLISPEGDKILERFNAENSPLPSDNIQKISIDPITGDVYIGTDFGLMSYRGASTEGGATNKDVLVFPNPVRSGYTGTIAIRGLVENADVRITDVSGQLVYRTKAYGGQAVWNGKDYTGRRPQTGVYLIFITNKDGSETSVGKMVFME